MVNDYKQLHTGVLWHNHRSTRQALRGCRTLALDDQGVAHRECAAPPSPAHEWPPAWLRGPRLQAAPLVEQTTSLGFDVRHHVTGDTVLEGHTTHPPQLPYDRFVFASFNNYQKLDPATFDMWANVLRRVPHSVLWMLQHRGFEVGWGLVLSLGAESRCWRRSHAPWGRGPLHARRRVRPATCETTRGHEVSTRTALFSRPRCGSP